MAPSEEMIKLWKLGYAGYSRGAILGAPIGDLADAYPATVEIVQEAYDDICRIASRMEILDDGLMLALGCQELLDDGANPDIIALKAAVTERTCQMFDDDLNERAYNKVS